MSKALNNVVVVAYGRSPVGRAYKGSLKNLHPVDLGAQVLKGTLAKVPQLDPADIDDIIVGCARPQDFQGTNMARPILLRAGLPFTVTGQTINRFCSSGLQAISTAANAIAAGQADIIVAGGVEMMTYMPSMKAGGTVGDVQNKWLKENIPGVYMPMGITAENVAAQYDVSREAMDTLAAASHAKAAAAQEEALKRSIAGSSSKGSTSGGRIVYSGGVFCWPAPSYTYISSPFGYRIHPVYGTRKYHSGLDLAAPGGSPILAAADGTVRFSGWNGGYGNCLIIDHGGGIQTLYGHSSKLLVSVGQKVSRGQKVALVGTTGTSTGNHLHFEVLNNGVATDPMPYLQ